MMIVVTFKTIMINQNLIILDDKLCTLILLSKLGLYILLLSMEACFGLLKLYNMYARTFTRVYPTLQ